MAWNRDQITGLLLEAGERAQRLKATMRRDVKHDHSLVTCADREIEALFSEAVDRPDAGTFLIGEETVAQKGEAYIQEALQRECFVVDPIDGTAPYAHLLPLWGISVGRMEGGVLTDGAVYLPDFGEIALSDGEEVILGIRENSEWQWTPLEGRKPLSESHGLVSVTQAVAKYGRVDIRNPVVVLGAAVVPMVGLLQGRFLAYLGSVKLWDLAGALPLLLRRGFAATIRVGDEIREVTDRVDEHTYHLEIASEERWALRSDLLICRPEDTPRFRNAFSSGGA